jgi:beta-N-acetylhexosaminidase
MPSDPEAAIRAVVAAVASGRLTRQRIRESVVKILSAKEKLGLDRKRLVDLEGLGDVINSPASAERAQQIADSAVTLVRNHDNLVPLADPEKTCFVTMMENRFGLEGQAFSAEVHKRSPRARITALDPGMSRVDVDAAIERLSSCQSYAVAAFSAVSAYRGSVGMAGELERGLEALAGSGRPVVLVAMGNPYLLRNFPGVAAYLATFSTVPTSEVAAVRALWGEIAVRGHLPVTIPGCAALGEGIQLAATRASGTDDR